MDVKNLKVLLERLNPHCAKAIEAGASFAATRGHYEVAMEHVVIKLLEEGGGDFDRLLYQFKLNLDTFWQATLDDLSRLPAGNHGKPSFSLALFQWLERAWLATSLHYGGEQIRSIALLDALLEMFPLLPGKAFALLDDIGLEQLRANWRELTAGSSEESRNAAPPRQNGGQSAAAAAEGGEGTMLDNFTVDLTKRAAAGEIDPVLGRGVEIRQAVDILSRRRKNNPIVVGEAGVGKTAIVEGLAIAIAKGEVPEIIANVRLLTLDLGLLQAGAGVKGEFEQRLKGVIDEVKNSATPIILFIDEAHTLIGAGGDAGQGDAANLLKPALARGELRTVAATTWSEYKKYFERDAALARRFQLIKVEEPSEENAIVMLSGLKDLYQRHHNVLISDDAIEAAVRLSHRYISGRQLPDKAIDLIDTAAARVCMGQSATPSAIEGDQAHLRYLEGRIKHLEEDRAGGLTINERQLAALVSEQAATKEKATRHESQWQQEQELVGRIRELRQDDGEIDHGQVRQIQDQLHATQGESPMMQAEVNGQTIATVVADWTGIPVGKMVSDDISALVDFEAAIGSRVIGQTAATSAMGRAVRVSKASLANPEAPLGVFLLAGPSGVGKTETALAVADQMFGGQRFITTINMSEYQEGHTVSQLKGSPPGYVGYGEGGVLTEAVRQRPYSVILLDEVEKAHPDVMNLFYQVFDRGFMRDGEGREIDFANTMIIMTSNLGAAEIMAACTPPEDGDNGQESQQEEWQPPGPAELTSRIEPQLMAHFAPALVARMQVIPYYPLDHAALETIVALKLDALAARLKASHAMEMRCSAAALASLAARCQQTATGARFVNTLLEQQLMPGIATSILGFMAEDDMPDILTLELDEAGELSCLFADRQPEEEEEEEQQPAENNEAEDSKQTTECSA
ncbi:MAG: type VI secretion system ATPase TssH [Thermodesulfobacteriota bacterium]